jgi:HD-like signal output (HDOD) protein
MARILCVHDDTAVLESMRRALLEHERSWEVRLATSADSGLATFGEWPPDCIVAGVGPHLDGIGLLTQVRDRRPETIRIAYGGSGEAEAGLRAMKIAHRGLPGGSFNTERFLDAIRRAIQLRDIVTQPQMRALLGRVGALPAVPGVFAELTRRLEDPSVSVFELGEIVSEDPALAAQVLRFANSAYFGRDQSVSSLTDATARLGTRVLRSLVLTAEVYHRFPVPPALTPMLEAQQRHASLVARIASSLEPRGQWKDDAFTAGLLHDVGKLVFVARLPDTYLELLADAEESGREVYEMEIAQFGVHHGTLGACLLGMWGLPSHVVEAVQAHHDISFEIPHALNATRAVALADRLAHDVTDPEDVRELREALPIAVLTDPRWTWWREMAEQMASESVAA